MIFLIKNHGELSRTMKKMVNDYVWWNPLYLEGDNKMK